MDCTAELTGLVRRVSPSAYERLLLLFHYLLSSSSINSSNRDTSAGAQHDDKNLPTLSLHSIFAVLCCACPGAAPRFLFAVGGSGTLLRSPDRGHTWRVSFARTSATEAVSTTAGVMSAATTSPSEPVDLLEEMQRLVKSASAVAALSEEEDAENTTVSAAVVPSVTAAPVSTVCDADGYEEIVALCGPDGFLAVSGDRGVTFTTTTDYLAAEQSSSTPNTPLKRICVLDRHHLVISDGQRVVRVDIAEVSYGRLALGAGTTVLTCTSQVVLLKAYSTACGGRALLVSENGALHLSLDGAVTFLEVRHCLGTIRDVDPMDALRRCQQPVFSFTAVESSLAVGDAAPTTTATAAVLPRNQSAPPSSPSSYAYVSGYKRELNSNVNINRSDHSSRNVDLYHMTALANFEQAAQHHPAGIFYKHFFVSGCGAAVLPYDYTAVLCVCTRRSSPPKISASSSSTPSGCIHVIASATRVSYVPFSHARRHSPLPCAVVRRANGGTLLAARGSSVGLSTSSDLEHWSTPQGAAPVGLIPMAGGELLACGRLKVITTVGGVAAESVVCTVPSELRVPYLVAAFAM